LSISILLDKNHSKAYYDSNLFALPKLATVQTDQAVNPL